MSRMDKPASEHRHEPPSRAALAAAVGLLGDADLQVARAARAWLQQCGEPARAVLAPAVEHDEVRVRLQARALLRALDVRQYLERFAALELDLDPGHAGPRQAMPLLDGAVLVSHMVRTFAPGADDLKVWLRLEAERLRRRFAGRSLPMKGRMLAERLHGELGLRGGAPEAMSLDRVLLDRVLHGRVGAPVTLSLIYLLAGRRAGLSMSGVGMPGYFLVRIHGPRPVLVDPFHGGRLVTKADCVRFLRGHGHHRVKHHLRDLSDREVLAQYLRCLRRAAADLVGAEARRTLGSALAALESE
jgi:regulator of sirC expression with transglutaminase-like and TPR domain